MFRLWSKVWKDNHLIKDLTYEDDRDINRTKKIFDGLEDACYQFDLSKPIWLERCINDFKRHAKTRFYQDSFIEQIDFDYLEIHVIEE